jgi:hypothetical protein
MISKDNMINTQKKQYIVDGYTMKTLTSKYFKFYSGITEIKNKKMVEDMVRNGLKIIAVERKSMYD